MTDRDNIADDLRRLLPADLLSIARTAGRAAEAHKTRAVLVGGVVRDLLLGRPIIDADIMIEPPVAPVAHDLEKLTKGRLVEHDRFQTYNLAIPGGRKIDLVTAREETYPAPAVLPKVVAATIEKDLRRRDFTINAMVAWLDDRHFGDVTDPFGGRNDLSTKTLRALHEKSFIDDPTRIFRAARFAGRLGFRVEPVTRGWIDQAIASGAPARLSAVRRRHEFELILKEDAPTAALSILRDWDALRLLHPDWGRADVRAIGLDAVRQVEGGRPLLVERLHRWLKWWGPQRARRMLDDLGFERTMKRALAEALKGP